MYISLTCPNVVHSACSVWDREKEEHGRACITPNDPDDDSSFPDVSKKKENNSFDIAEICDIAISISSHS